MKKVNIKKTRILIFETLRPAYQDLPASVNEDYFEIAAIVDNESTVAHSGDIPVVSFEQVLDFSFWDLLVINDEAFGNSIRKILSMLEIPEERYIFLQRSIDRDEIPFYRTLFRTDSQNGRVLDYFCRKLGENYLAVTTKGGDYITYASDCVISENMFRKRETYSQEEIDIFVQLAKQYYGTSQEEKGFFFDIGANIGTTCIYAKKYLVPNMSVVAFEPVYKNFKILLANMVLNDITDYIAVNKAVSDVSGTYGMRFNALNPGESAIVSEGDTAESSDLQAVESVSADVFLKENHINPADVRYVWIDTEGFEANVLKGAGTLLAQEKTAFYMEYAPAVTDVKRLEEVADICAKHFRRFICIDDFFAGDTQPRPIEELGGLYKRYPVVTNIFLIK